MKLRIKGNTIRLRLTQTEVRTIQSDHFLSDGVDFLDEPLRYQISSEPEVDDVRVSFRQGHLTVHVPRQIIQSWAQSDLVGFEGLQSEGDKTVKLLVEKDFACLKPREGEDDSDAFPHPEENNPSSLC